MPFYAPSLHLLPTTPPESDCFDKALIVDDIFHFGELEDDPTCSPPHQCSVLQPKALAHFSSPALSTTSGTSYKTVPLNPATLYPLNPALAVGQALGRGIDAKMNVPVPGTVTAVVAFHTGTLATYAARLFVRLWFARHDRPSTQSISGWPSSHLDSSDLFPYPSTTNPLQIQPSLSFSNFVANLLQTTKVSHSVAIVALLYTHRLKLQTSILNAAPGSELNAFIASLMLSNKYLDDNTYTNPTWAKLTGFPTSMINSMEAEFLENIHYDLSVKSSEFKYWRQLLDDFILSAPRQNLPPSAHTSLAPVYPAPSLVARESTYTVSSLPGGESHSSSLRGWSPSDILSYEPSTFRKRTAADAFIDEMFSTVSNSAQPSTASRTAAVDQSSVSTHLVQPSRMMAREVMRRAVPSNYDHVRSSSPNRQIVALPRSGHLSPVGWSGQSRDAACEAESGNVFAPQAHMHESKDQNSLARIHDGSGCSVLVAPYEGQYQVQAIAPENLRFYSLAAASHDRQSGAARKAILCYQDPNPAYNPYMPQSAHLHPGGAPVSEVPPMIQSLPPIAYTQLAYQPEPAQFANAGPPGYAYNPASYSQDYTANQGSFSSDQVLFDGSTAPSAWRNRSEWSFPTTQYDGWQPEPPQ